MAEYGYRAIEVTTRDYGDPLKREHDGTPIAGPVAIATLAIIPDGSHWQDRPQTITTRVPLGTRPGGLWRVVIEPVE